MDKKYKLLEKLYKNNIECALKFGMKYTEDTQDWILRKGKPNSFRYYDSEGEKIHNQKILKYIKNLVIPPQWEKTLISPLPSNHILVVGFDAKERKQYIYNEKWAEARKLINSYKLIIFGETLGDIRTHYKKLLKASLGSYEYSLGAFLFLLDETVIRVGNPCYLNDNGTVGISTLTSRNVIVKKNSLCLEFIGKSKKEHSIKIDNKKLRVILKNLSSLDNTFLFSYVNGDKKFDLEPSQINNYINEIGSDLVSGKDFRTWHASLIVFSDFIEKLSPNISDMKTKKVILESFDNAAEKLGNTRTVLRNSYAHAGLVETAEEKHFLDDYIQVQDTKKLRNLSQTESEFLAFLKLLYKNNTPFKT